MIMSRFFWFFIGVSGGVLMAVLCYQAIGAGAPLPIVFVFAVFVVLCLLAKADDRKDNDD